MKMVGDKELLEAIKTNLPSYTNTYFNLRQFKIRYINPKTVELVRFCIALKRCGLPIRSQSLNFLRPNTRRQSNIVSLHLLGDKHILTLKRRSGKYEWIINPSFLKLWMLKEKTNEKKVV